MIQKERGGETFVLCCVSLDKISHVILRLRHLLLNISSMYYISMLIYYNRKISNKVHCMHNLRYVINYDIVISFLTIFRIPVMEATMNNAVPVRPDLIMGFSRVFDISTAVLCSFVVALDILSNVSTLIKEFLDVIVKFLNKTLASDPVQDILVYHLSSAENQTQLLSAPISVYRFNGHLTHIKPAGRFYLLIFPMQLYVMFMIFLSKIVNEQEISIREVNLTVSFEEQNKFYQCSNNTGICTSYMFKTENLIDTVTNLISWWMGLEFVKSKMTFFLHKQLMKFHRLNNIPTSVRCRLWTFQCSGWIFEITFVVYIVSGIREFLGFNWFPLVMSVILLVCVLSGVLAEHTSTWMTLGLEKQRLVAHEKELNMTRPVLILDKARPKSVLETLVRESISITSISLPHQTLNKIIPSIDEKRAL